MDDRKRRKGEGGGKALSFADIRRMRERGEPVPPEAQEALDRAGQQAAGALRRLAAWRLDLAPEWDWALLIDPQTPADRRWEAVKRVLARLHGPPIHRKRWLANKDRIMEAMRDMAPAGADTEAPGWWRGLLEDRIGAAGYMAAGKLVDMVERRGGAAADAAAVVPEARARFRGAVERLVMEDLLGAGWRSHHEREAPLEAASAETRDAGAEAVVAGATLETLAAAARLTDAERELLEAYLDAGDWPDAYRALDLKPATGRKRKHTLLPKLRRTTPR